MDCLFSVHFGKLDDTLLTSQTKRKKKIAAAVYLYQVDNDDEWDEISFDFESGTAEVIRLAKWDTTISKQFAKQIIQCLFSPNSISFSQNSTVIIQ